MKKFLYFLKSLVVGIWPTAIGVLIAWDMHCIVNNIRSIPYMSGWPVVWVFCLTIVLILLTAWFLSGLGNMVLESNKWVKYTQQQKAQTIDSSSSDIETSDKATDTSSTPVTTKRGSKKSN